MTRKRMSGSSETIVQPLMTVTTVSGGSDVADSTVGLELAVESVELLEPQPTSSVAAATKAASMATIRMRI